MVGNELISPLRAFTDTGARDAQVATLPDVANMFTETDVPASRLVPTSLP